MARDPEFDVEVKAALRRMHDFTKDNNMIVMDAEACELMVSVGTAMIIAGHKWKEVRLKQSYKSRLNRMLDEFDAMRKELGYGEKTDDTEVN